METPVPNFYFMGVQFLHLLALAIWVGGLIIIRCIVAPILLQSSPPQQSGHLLLHEVFGKFCKITLVCAGVLLVSGVIKFFSWENLTPWNAIRYLSILVMIVVSLYVNYGVFPRMSETTASASNSSLENAKRSSATQLNHLYALADRLMMISLIFGLTATLMA